MKYYAEIGGQKLELEVEEREEDLEVTVAGKTMVANLQRVSAPSLYSLILDNESHEVFVDQRDGHYVVLIAGEQYTVKIQDERARRLAAVSAKARSQDDEIVIKAPMPGLVVSLAVSPGDVVEKGQGLVVLEAMKMQNELRAPRHATVKLVNVQQGARVENGRVLVVLA
jgi:biotin carboxyl carrier protein